MVVFEAYARWFLVIHTVAAAALVAVSTHTAVWMRGYPRGRFNRHKGVRKLAGISAALFVITFLLGNAVYPTYKTRVRAEYLDSPQAVASDAELRRQGRAHLVEAENRRRQVMGEAPLPAAGPQPAPGATDGPRTTAKVARWFDVKEHWVALGMAMSIGLVFIVIVWDPRKQGASIASLVFALAVGTAATTWIGGIVGIVVSSYRAVGGL